MPCPECSSSLREGDRFCGVCESSVDLADDLELGQPVALRFLPTGLADDQDRLQRFLNEVKIARQVSHPNVCSVYDVGETEGQQ